MPIPRLPEMYQSASGGQDGAPVEIEERGDRADVERGHRDGRDPVDARGNLAAVNLRRDELSHATAEGISTSRSGIVIVVSATLSD